MCMMKVMIVPSDVKTQCVFGWISIIWFTSVVGIAVGRSEEPVLVSAQCGQNLTLPCEGALFGVSSVRTSWVVNDESMCQWTPDQPPDPKADLCEHKHPDGLALPLHNVMPNDTGTYLCKILSTSGPKSTKTILTVQDCLESSDAFIVEKHAMCWFSGVFPRGIIYWFQGDVNLTEHADPKEVKDEFGRYNVSSTIDVQKGNESQSYNCSLWIPSTGKYLKTQRVPSVGKQSSAGKEVKLQWICIMVEIMMLKLLR